MTIWGATLLVMTVIAVIIVTRQKRRTARVIAETRPAWRQLSPDQRTVILHDYELGLASHRILIEHWSTKARVHAVERFAAALDGDDA